MSQLLTTGEFIFALVLMLGVVITVHEYGHFIVAKWCNVRILKFSIGFGSPIGIGRFRLSKVWNGTEYAICWIPLGGYVRMLGESDEEVEEPREGPGEPFSEKPLWQKLLVLVAGPAMNLVLPVVLFACIYAVGLNREAAIIGTVERGSPAAEAGLHAGDRVTQIDGNAIFWWSDLVGLVRGSPGESLSWTVERAGRELTVQILTEGRRGIDTFRTPVRVGWIGVQHTRLRPVLGVPDASSLASDLGFRSGDRVLSVSGVPIDDWGQLELLQRSRADSTLKVEVERSFPDGPQTLVISAPGYESFDKLGLIAAVVTVAAVTPFSAAAEAGILQGDMIVGLDGEPLGSFSAFQEAVLAGGGGEMVLTVARNGESFDIKVQPRLVEVEISGTPLDAYRIGIEGKNINLAGVYDLDRELNPLVGLARGAEKTAEITVLFMRGLKKMVLGEISGKSIGGPIEIARQSHRALKTGWESFVEMLILISVNIGILNMLPIPVLDGGQALMYSVEGLSRGRLSKQVRGLFQQFGMIFLLAIMAFAFWNDISRNWSTFFDWLTGF